VDVNTVGDYTITYTATDASNNVSTLDRTVTVQDTTAPVITLTGKNPLTWKHGTTYVDPGASTDDGSNILTTGTVNVNTLGAYTITYTATNAAGIPAVQKTRTVTVIFTNTVIPNANNSNKIRLSNDGRHIRVPLSGTNPLTYYPRTFIKVSRNDSAFQEISYDDMTFDFDNNILDIPIEQSYATTTIKMKIGRRQYNVDNDISVVDPFQENALSNMISAKYIYANKKVFLEVTPIEGFSVAAQNIVISNTQKYDVPVDTASYDIVEGSFRAHVHKYNESYSYTDDSGHLITRQYDIHTESWLVTGLTLQKGAATKTYSFYVIGSNTRFAAEAKQTKQIVTIADEVPPIPTVTFCYCNPYDPVNEPKYEPKHTAMILTFQSSVGAFGPGGTPHGTDSFSDGDTTMYCCGFWPTFNNRNLSVTHWRNNPNVKMPKNQIIVNFRNGLIPQGDTWTLPYKLLYGAIKFVDMDGNPVDGKLPMPDQTFEITYEKAQQAPLFVSKRSEIQFSRSTRVSK
jgi:hypothetical protein